MLVGEDGWRGVHLSVVFILFLAQFHFVVLYFPSFIYFFSSLPFLGLVADHLRLSFCLLGPQQRGGRIKRGKFFPLWFALLLVVRFVRELVLRARLYTVALRVCARPSQCTSAEVDDFVRRNAHSSPQTSTREHSPTSRTSRRLARVAEASLKMGLEAQEEKQCSSSMAKPLGLHSLGLGTSGK